MKHNWSDSAFVHLRTIVMAVGLGLGAGAAMAQATPVFEQSFASGLGRFTAAGGVTTGVTGAVMRASLFSTDGSITSSAISTVGYTGLTLSFNRVTASLSTTESGVAEVSVNNGTFTSIESTRATTNTRVTFTLPATAANQANVRLRFRVAGNSSGDTYTVNTVTLSGTAGTGGGGGGTTGATPPARGDFATFESGQVRPLVLSADGTRLYAANTPDNRIEVYNVSGSTPT